MFAQLGGSLFGGKKTQRKSSRKSLRRSSRSLIRGGSPSKKRRSPTNGNSPGNRYDTLRGSNDPGKQIIFGSNAVKQAQLLELIKLKKDFSRMGEEKFSESLMSIIQNKMESEGLQSLFPGEPVEERVLKIMLKILNPNPAAFDKAYKMAKVFSKMSCRHS